LGLKALDVGTLKADLPRMANSTFTSERTRLSALSGIEHYIGSIAMVGVCTLVGIWIAPRWGTAAVDMIYLPAVLAAAALWGFGPALVAGLASALAYNFFFTAPVHTLRMDRVTDVVTVAVLLIVALVTSQLAAAIRKQARVAAAHAARNATIAGFARHLLSCSSERDIAETAAVELGSLFDCNAMLVAGLPEPHVVAARPENSRLTPSDIAAAAFALETGEPAGRGTKSLQPAEWVFYPIRSKQAVIAAAGLARDDGARPVDEDRDGLLISLIDQVALALERARLEREARTLAGLHERDRLRSVLLSSIGNDLNPRLDALIDAAREQRRNGTSEKAFVSTVESEANKLQRYVANLLDFDPVAEQQPIEAAGVSIDLFRRAVCRDGVEVHLTPKEYAVLAELAKHPGRVLTHGHLLRAGWGPAQESQTEYLRVAIRALRQKLEPDPARPRLILNEPAVGYRLAIS
jgi:two-component system sensor histidine kinase KdpD